MTNYYYSHLIYKIILDCLIIIHKNGGKIGDSNEKETSISNESFKTKEQFLNSTSVKLALEGKSGNIVEKFNGIKGEIRFIPYSIFQNKKNFILSKLRHD